MSDVRLTRGQADAIVRAVAELADIAASRDLHAAEMVLSRVARTLRVDPMTLPEYRAILADI